MIKQVLAAVGDAEISKLLTDPAFQNFKPELRTPGTKISDLLNLKSGSTTILTFVFIIIGIYFFASLIIAGWAFMMSSGDVKKASAAAGNITNAFAGLIMVFTAFLIVRIITTALGIANPF